MAKPIFSNLGPKDDRSFVVPMNLNNTRTGWSRRRGISQ
jgi:hypothetical protein